MAAPGAEPLPVSHPTLAMARLRLGRTAVLLACSVLPWRQAGEHWPQPADGPGDTERFAGCLDAHLAEIARPRGTGRSCGAMAAEALVRHLDGRGASDHDAYLVRGPLG